MKSTHPKNISQIGSSPQVEQNKTYLKPPPRKKNKNTTTTSFHAKKNRLFTPSVPCDSKSFMTARTTCTSPASFWVHGRKSPKNQGLKHTKTSFWWRVLVVDLDLLHGQKLPNYSKIHQGCERVSNCSCLFAQHPWHPWQIVTSCRLTWPQISLPIPHWNNVNGCQAINSDIDEWDLIIRPKNAHGTIEMEQRMILGS